MATHTMQERIAELKKRREEARLGGGADKLEKHRASGKLTARERIDALVDPDSFEETGMFAQHRATSFGMEGKDPNAAPAPAPAQAPAVENGKGPVKTPITYDVKLNGRSHRVTVTPA